MNSTGGNICTPIQLVEDICKQDKCIIPVQRLLTLSYIYIINILIDAMQRLLSRLYVPCSA